MYLILVALHILAAAVWIGGHFTLVVGVLQAALRAQDATPIAAFEQSFGKVTLASLAVLTLTGVALEAHWLGEVSRLLDLSHQVSRMVILKLILLVVTASLGGHAYHSVLPRLRASGLAPSHFTPGRLPAYRRSCC